MSVHRAVDEEKIVPGDLHEKPKELHAAESRAALESEKLGHADIFSWKNIQYEVPISGGEMRKLLDGVSGYVAPRNLTALMGETGAGKVGVQGIGSLSTDRGDVLADGVIEHTRSAHLGRCRAW